MKTIFTYFLFPGLFWICLLGLLLSCKTKDPKRVREATANNAAWELLSTNSPTLQSEYDMAYDSKNKKLIAYGGRTGFPDFNNVNETWAFDYSTQEWENLQASNSPPWRSSHTMIYDEIGERILMFGGNDFEQVYNDLWSFDYKANNWEKIHTGSAPEARQMHGMVYIPDRKLALLFGGRRSGGGAHFEDSWIFDCSTNSWRELKTENIPPVSDHVNLAYDSFHKKVILFVGPDKYVLGNGKVRPQSTWAFDFEKNNWEKIEMETSPDSDHSNLEFDPVSKKLVLFGNSQNQNGVFSWLFDYANKSWVELKHPSFPKIDYIKVELMEHDAMAYLPDQQVFIQYGGCCSSSTLMLTLNSQ